MCDAELPTFIPLEPAESKQLAEKLEQLISIEKEKEFSTSEELRGGIEMPPKERSSASQEDRHEKSSNPPQHDSISLKPVQDQEKFKTF